MRKDICTNVDGDINISVLIIGGLWRILDFLNVLYASQQLGNRTLPRVRPEPWMANVEWLRQAKKPKSEHLENLISVTRPPIIDTLMLISQSHL